MSGAAKSFLPLEPINIKDATLERLQLMEKVQHGHDFLLTIYAQNATDAHKLAEFSETLNPHKYSSFIEKDATGQDVLRLHYVGRETGVAAGFAKLGSIGGAIHAAEAIANPIMQLGSKASDFAKYATSEPARLLSGLYFLGDVFYANAGKGDSLESKLINASGKMAILQSAIYMAFARDGSEYEIENIQRRLDKLIASGNNPSDESLWEAPAEKKGIINDALRFVQKDPIKIGAFAQMGGQSMLAASGALSIANGNKDGIWDIARAATSIAAWAMLQIDEKHVDEKTDWLRNPVARVAEEIQDSPHIYASMVNTAASLFGIKSSLNKIKNVDEKIAVVDAALAKNQPSDEWQILQKEKIELLSERPNTGQILAELTYLSGDLTMFFLRKSEYGEDAASNTKGAAKAAAHFIQQSGLMMSETPLKEFVGNLSTYLAGRIVHEQVRDGVMFSDMIQAQTELISGELNRNIFTKLAEQQSSCRKAANIVARISDLYPQEQQEKIEITLIENIASFTGANINIAEMQQEVAREHGNFIGMQRKEPPSINQVSDLLVDLTRLLPDIHAGNNIDTLYKTMLDFSKPQPQITSAKLEYSPNKASKQDLIIQL